MPSLTHSPTQITLTLGITQTLGWGSTFYLPAILAVPMAEDLNTTTGAIFAAFSAALLMNAVLGPAIGKRIDSHGGRAVLTLSSIIFATGLVLLAFADSLISLWMAWLVLGVGMSMGLYDAAFATLAGIYGAKARSSITGITLIAGFASTICWPITAVLEHNIGWRGACLVWAAVHLGPGLLLNWFGQPSPIAPVAKTAPVAKPSLSANLTVEEKVSLTEGNSTPPTTPPLPKHGAYTIPMLAFVFTSTLFISTGLAAHLPRLLTSAGLSSTAAIATAALLGPAQVVARLAEYSLLRHAHPMISTRVASLAHPVGALALVALGTPLAMLFTLLHGAGNGIMTIAKGTLPLAIFGPQGYGHRVGLMMVPARITQAIAPFIFAVMLTAWGSDALLLTAALGVASFIVLSILNRQLHRRQS